MLLTLSAPTKSEFDIKYPHDFPPPLHSTITRPSSDINGNSHRSLLASASSIMSGPHRGLPPPAAMNLPEPNRAPPPVSHGLGQMPLPPPQWQGAEESMKSWLSAKAEEERRRQEEERTRQETLRLEQRKIEQQMLQDAMRAGVPPHMVPLIFAGLSGANIANLSIEMLQQYVAQFQAAQQQQQQQHQQQQIVAQSQLSPERSRDTRFISQTQSGYGIPPQSAQQPPIAPGQPLAPPPQPASAYPAYQTAPLSPPGRSRLAQPQGPAPPPTSAPRAPLQSQLPRLTTNEMQPQHHSTGPSSVNPQTSQVAQQEQPQASPSIYFHHWVPPQADKKKDDSTSGKRQDQQSHYPASHVTEPDYTSSPKRRKTQTGGQPPFQQVSPAFSQASSTHTPGRRGRGHSRTSSDAPTARGYEATARPPSRHGLHTESRPPSESGPEAHRSNQ